jgi:hypothetical protein
MKLNKDYNELKKYANQHINKNGEETRKKCLDNLLNKARDGNFKGTNKDLLIRISKLIDVNCFYSFRNR